jgi:hypothetical protein
MFRGLARAAKGVLKSLIHGCLHRSRLGTLDSGGGIRPAGSVAWANLLVRAAVPSSRREYGMITLENLAHRRSQLLRLPTRSSRLLRGILFRTFIRGSENSNRFREIVLEIGHT